VQVIGKQLSDDTAHPVPSYIVIEFESTDRILGTNEIGAHQFSFF
jgi:hypothetical protein